MVCCERAPPTGPVEQAPSEGGLVELLLHERLVPLDIVLLLLGCEAELHVDLLFGSRRAPLVGRSAERAVAKKIAQPQLSDQRGAPPTQRRSSDEPPTGSPPARSHQTPAAARQRRSQSAGDSLSTTEHEPLRTPPRTMHKRGDGTTRRRSSAPAGS